MSSRNFLLVGLTVIAVVALIAAGCSSKKTADNSAFSTPEYTFMVAQVDQTVDSLVALTGLGLNMTVAASTDILTDIAFGPMPVDSESVEDLWHIFVLTNSSSGASNHWVDSVQFSRNTIPQVDPAGADALQYVRNWEVTAEDTTVTYSNLSARTVLTAINADENIATVSGQYAAILHSVDKSGTDAVVRDLTLDAIVSNYTVSRGNEWNSGCPTTAQVTIDASLTVKVGSADATTSSWSFTMTLDDGHAQGTITLGTAIAQYLHVACSM
jgi:hypothetical protein